MTTRNKTILLVGGGTGGHIVPILNIRQELLNQKAKINIITIGGTSAMDQKLYGDIDNHISLTTGKLHRTITLENFVQIFLFIWGLISSLNILTRTKPDLIFSKAGYVSFPIIFWSKLLHIPYFIHESDIEMGKTNKFAAKGANKIFVGFPVNNYPWLPKDKLEYVGQIFRPDFLQKEHKSFDFGFDSTKSTIFVTGGSQGSQNINKAVFQILKDLLLDYNVIHHTGSLDYEKAMTIRSMLPLEEKNSYFISPLLTKTSGGIDMMKSAILQSELIICRASATTLAEVSTMDKAIITVPYKYAAADHQTKNANFYKKNDAVVVISDNGLSGDSLKKEITSLFRHPSLMKEMGEKAHKLQITDGLSRITEEMNSFINSI